MNIENILMVRLFLLILLINMAGCREEIIDPLNPATNVNEPVQSITSKSYSFSINAVDISKEVDNSTSLYTQRNRILVTANDYKTGSVSIIIYDQNGNKIYNTMITSEENGLYASITGRIPNRIQFLFTNFTGRLKFEISPLY